MSFAISIVLMHIYHNDLPIATGCTDWWRTKSHLQKLLGGNDHAHSCHCGYVWVMDNGKTITIQFESGHLLSATSIQLATKDSAKLLWFCGYIKCDVMGYGTQQRRHPIVALKRSLKCGTGTVQQLQIWCVNVVNETIWTIAKHGHSQWFNDIQLLQYILKKEVRLLRKKPYFYCMNAIFIVYFYFFHALLNC